MKQDAGFFLLLFANQIDFLVYCPSCTDNIYVEITSLIYCFFLKNLENLLKSDICNIFSGTYCTDRPWFCVCYCVRRPGQTTIGYLSWYSSKSYVVFPRIILLSWSSLFAAAQFLHLSHQSPWARVAILSTEFYYSRNICFWDLHKSSCS